jgi:CHAD domain-containing protein
VVERFFRAVPAGRTDKKALHRFRIRGKELRYAMELVTGAFPDQLRAKFYPALKAIQDRLGAINDRATATTRLQQQIEAASDATDRASWRRLLAHEQAQLDQARQEFWKWCTPAMLRELRDGFEAMLVDSVQAGSSQHG